MRLIVLAIFLWAAVLSGCASPYAAPEGRPTANVVFSSETASGSGRAKATFLLELGEVAPLGGTAPETLGRFLVKAGDIDQVMKIEADRMLQFVPVMVQSSFFCQAPFKAKLSAGLSYVLKMNLDTGLGECEIELISASETPARRMGTARESSARMNFSSSGGSVTSRLTQPARPFFNPTFE